MKNREWIGTIEAARFCGVSRPAFRKWIDRGLIEAYVTPGGTARVPVRRLVKTMREHRMPIPDDLLRLYYTRILIVDDEEEIRNIMIAAIKSNDHYELETAENGYEACIRMGNFRPDIILFDLMMPLMNGVELLKEIRRNQVTRDTCVVVVTGYPECREAIQVIENGVDGFFAKPVRLLDLTKKIEELAGV